MNIGQALTFFTEEERWIEKTTIGALVLLASTLLSFVLVGVLGFFIIMGYSVRLMRNVQQGVRPVLPEWDQWSEDLVRGLKLFVVQFVWALPIFLVVLPVIFGAAIADNSRGAGEFFGTMLILCGSCLSVLYGLFVVLVQPGFTIAFARDEQIGSGLRLTPIWQWTRAHLSDVAVVAIVYVVGSLIIGTVASIVGVILCGIGLLVTMPLGQLVIYYFQYHLYGQLDPGILAPSYSRAAAYDTGFGATSTVASPVVTPTVTPDEPKPVVDDTPTTPPADLPSDEDKI